MGNGPGRDRTCDQSIMSRLPDSRKSLSDKVLTDTDDDRLAFYLAFLDENDPDLAAVVTAWPKLPEAIKVGIRAMVKAGIKGPEDRF